MLIIIHVFDVLFNHGHKTNTAGCVIIDLMVRKIVWRLIGLIIIGLILTTPATAGQLWLEDLRPGDRKPAVRRLQQFLNQNPATQLTSVGPGSPGRETDYFGLLTRQAVIRLQEQQAAEILWPLGLNQGTGLVGPATRAWLNSVTEPIDRDQSVKPEPPPIDPAEIQKDKAQSAIDSVGNGLAGRPELKDLSTKLNWSTESPAGQVRLDRLSPASGPAGSTITISGRGFSQSGNTVYTGLSVIGGLESPDSRQLTFTLPDLNLTNSPTETFSIPLWIYVRSEAGLSNNLIFNLIVQ